MNDNKLWPLRIHVSISKKQKDWLGKQKHKQNKPINEIIRDLIDKERNGS